MKKLLRLLKFAGFIFAIGFLIQTGIALQRWFDSPNGISQGMVQARTIQPTFTPDVTRTIQSTPAPFPTSTPAPVPTPWQDGDDSISASIMAERFVRDRLKAPSTAKFPSAWQYRDEVQVTREGQTYTVRSWVDAENSFGAMLRMNYVAVLEQTEPDDWQLLSLMMDE